MTETELRLIEKDFHLIDNISPNDPVIIMNCTEKCAKIYRKQILKNQEKAKKWDEFMRVSDGDLIEAKQNKAIVERLEKQIKEKEEQLSKNLSPSQRKILEYRYKIYKDLLGNTLFEE